MNNNIILTGLARSGTTLTVALLNKLDNVIALHEPIKFSEYPLMGESCVDDLIKYFQYSRNILLNKGDIETKLILSLNEANSYGSDRNCKNLRMPLEQRGVLNSKKKLTSEFLFVIKHPMAFTALMQYLAPAFRVYALIRNPLSVLASWNSINHPLTTGHAPQAEIRDMNLKRKLDDEKNVLMRQLIILDWAFGQFERFLLPSSVIRYEQIIATDGKALDVIDRNARTFEENLVSMNNNILYDRSNLDLWLDGILKFEGTWLKFYTPSKIIDIYENIKNS